MKHFLLPIIEYAVSLISVVIIIWYKLAYARSERVRETAEAKIKALLTKMMTEQLSFNEIDWEQEKIRFYPLLDVLEEFSDKFKDDHWNVIRGKLSDRFLIPWAIKHYRSRRWFKRNTAARIFLLNPKKQNLPMLYQLLQDRQYSIRMLATEAIGNLKLSATIPYLLKQMAREVPTARYIYRYVLLRMPHAYFPYIVQTFETCNSTPIKICCLDIMSHQYYGNVQPFLRSHINDKSPSIRKMLTKVLQISQTADAKEDLMQLTHDAEPQVRQAAVESLGELREATAFERISELLQDKSHAVRLTAAYALTKYGRKGTNILELQDADLAPEAHQVARYVLTLP